MSFDLDLEWGPHRARSRYVQLYTVHDFLSLYTKYLVYHSFPPNARTGGGHGGGAGRGYGQH